MDTGLKHTIVVSFAITAIVAGGISGCTYTVSRNNQLYYETMKQCIDTGGSFIPTVGGSSSAVCLHK